MARGQLDKIVMLDKLYKMKNKLYSMEGPLPKSQREELHKQLSELLDFVNEHSA